MPHPKSAVKRHRQSLRRYARNQTRRSAARSAVRRARELIAASSYEEAAGAIRAAASVLDRAARKGTLHPNNAARRKSRLMHGLHVAQAGAGAAAPRRRRTRATPGGETAARRTTRSRTKKG